MAVKLADAVAFMSTDNTKLKSGLAEAEGDIQKSGNGFSSVLSGVGMSIGMGVAGIAANALGKVTDFMGDSVDAASDLGETMSKVSVVFGENSDAVKAWGASAATALGQSQADALGAAATFGNLFVSMGMTSDSSSDMSMNLVELATDLASFNNMSTDEALDKLKAGMLGSAEPMQSLGVNMNAAMVEAKALAMGLAETKDELTPAALAQARYALILEQTTTAQGDFARTSGGLANQQRILDAQMGELSATIGNVLLPVQTAMTTGMNELLTTVLPPLVEFLQSNVMPAFTAIGEVLGNSVLPAIQGIIAWFTTLGGTMNAQTDGPFAYLSNWFYENMPRIQKIVETVLSAITAFWSEHGDTIMGVVGWLFEFVVTNIQDSMKTVMDIVQAILQIITGDFSGAGDTLGGIMDRWRERILGAWAAITTGIKDWWNGIDWGEMGRSILEGLAAGITGAVGLAVQAMQNAGRAILDAIKGFFGIRSPSQVMADEVGKPLVDGLLGGFQQALGVASEINGALFGGIGSFFGISGGGGVAVTVNVYTSSSDPAAVGAGAAEGVLAGLRAAGIR